MGEDQRSPPRNNPPRVDVCIESKSFKIADRSSNIPMEDKDAIEASLRNIDKRAVVEEYFLHCLAFNTMDDREEEITAAHKATFNWILNYNENTDDMKSNNLISWLRDDHRQKVYWINGKPGSGKSTLMRFVYEHPNTTEILKDWAKDKLLICPRFFFWTSGTIEQKSAFGLLRSLLYQLLQQMRELIPWTFSEIWLKYQDARARVREPIVWSIEFLWSALIRFLKLSDGKVKICFFIDGLDELEGNQEELVDMLHSIVESSTKDFKACVSSRPWKIFEQAFANIPQLKLQDLTRNDIWRYVNDSLNDNEKVRRVLKENTKLTEELKSQVTENADGVFLWATLAVRTLVQDINSTNSVTNLIEKLSDLPKDLDNLFRYLLFKLKTTTELEEQSRILQIIQARDIVCDFTRHDSSNVVTLYQMTLANYWNLEVTNEPIKLPDTQILEKCESTKNHLLNRCAGLLRVHQRKRSNQEDTGVRFGRNDVDTETFAQGRIGYLHRTVRDYFVYSGDFDKITKQTNHSNFDPHISLLRSHVLQLIHPLEPPKKHRRLDEWWPDIVLAMTHARFVNPMFKDSQIELLDHFKSILDWYWLPRPMDPLDNWARNTFSTYERRMKYRTEYHYPFLSLATKFGLHHYVESKLDTGNYPYQGGIPLLTYAVEYLVSRRSSVYPLASSDLVQILLNKGEDVNLIYKDLANNDETPWIQVLKHIREADRKGWIEKSETEETNGWIRIVEDFIQHGADPNVSFLKNMWDPAATAMDILIVVHEKYKLPSLQRLLL